MVAGHTYLPLIWIIDFIYIINGQFVALAMPWLDTVPY